MNMKSFRGPRRLPVYLGATLVVLGSVVLPAQSAHAVPAVDLTCTLSANFTLTPGLVATQSRDFTLTGTGTYSSCLDTSGRPHPVLSGTQTVTGHGSGTCASANAVLNATITWNRDGGPQTTSTVQNNVALSIGSEGLEVLNATVTDGTFQGDTVEYSAVNVATTPTDCLTPGGATSFGLTGTVEFLHL